MDTLAETIFAEEEAREDGAEPEPEFIPVPLDEVVQKKARAIDAAYIGREPPPAAHRRRARPDLGDEDEEAEEGVDERRFRDRYDVPMDDDLEDARPQGNKRRKVHDAFDDLDSLDSASTTTGDAEDTCPSCFVCDILKDHAYDHVHHHLDKITSWVSGERQETDVGTLAFKAYDYWEEVVRARAPRVPMITPSEFRKHYEGCNKSDATIPIDDMLCAFNGIFNDIKDRIMVREQGKVGHRVDGTALETLTKTAVMRLRLLEARVRLVRQSTRKP